MGEARQLYFFIKIFRTVVVQRRISGLPGMCGCARFGHATRGRRTRHFSQACVQEFSGETGA